MIRIKESIILGIAVAVLLTYVFGPGAISAEYSKSREHYTTQTNVCSQLTIIGSYCVRIVSFCGK